MKTHDQLDPEEYEVITSFLHRHFCTPPPEDVMQSQLELLRMESGRLQRRESRNSGRALALTGIAAAALLALLFANQRQPTLTATDENPIVADATPASGILDGVDSNPEDTSSREVFDRSDEQDRSGGAAEQDRSDRADTLSLLCDRRAVERVYRNPRQCLLATSNRPPSEAPNQPKKCRRAGSD